MKKLIKKITVISITIFILNFFVPYIFPITNQINIAEAATVKLNKTKVNIKVGESYQLKLTGTKSKIRWSSNAKSIATVSSEGVVKGVKSGSARITASVGDKSYKCIVTVLYPTLSKGTFNAGIGDTFQLDIKNLPLTFSKDEIHYKSKNVNVAIVDEKGIITALSEGFTTVNVSFGSYKLQCTVIVSFNDKNKTDAINSLGIEYAEVNNQIICIIKNNSKVDLFFGYDLAFYDSLNNLVSVSINSGIRDGFFAGDEEVLLFNKPEKNYSYYRIRFNNIRATYIYKNIKDKVDITASEAYDYTYRYTEIIDGHPISMSGIVKAIDLNANNRSEYRAMITAYIVYYKDNAIVHIESFNNFDIDIGTMILKSPLTLGYINGKESKPDYDTYKVIYTAKTLKIH